MGKGRRKRRIMRKWMCRRGEKDEEEEGCGAVNNDYSRLSAVVPARVCRAVFVSPAVS